MRTIQHGALVAIAFAAAGCASTSMSSTWIDPSAEPLALEGKNAVAMVITENPGQRRAAETALADEISKRGLPTQPSYALLPGDMVRDTTRSRQALREANVEVVVVMRVVDEQQRTTYTPGTAYYGSTWGYWGYGWGAAYSPGYVTTDKILSVETLIFSVSQNKLVWAGQSETTNPSRIDSFMRELVQVVGNEVRKSGLIAESG